MLTINKEFLKSHKCYKGKNNPKYIVNHETDNYSEGAGARNHAKAQFSGNLGDASVHFYVDDKEIYQCLELSDGPWSVGDANYGVITNWNNISIEICVNPDSDYNTARKNAAELNKYLLEQYGWGMDRVKRHYDATYKTCPRKMIQNPNLWKEFIQWINTGDTSIKVDHNKPIYVATIEQSKNFIGNRAKGIQAKLMSLGYDLGSWGANGIWGEFSYNALLKFQKDNGLNPDGYCGPATTAKLNELYENKEEGKLLKECKKHVLNFGDSGTF
ncbi:peptidoglycan recognition protein family protein, partial [Clostridium paraputrificum]